MKDMERDRTIALAGVFQAALLAQTLARSGNADSDPLNASVRSILITDAINTPSVFGGISGVELGLYHLRDHLSVGDSKDMEVARYVLAMVQLQLRLKRQPEMIQTIGDALADLKRDLSEWDGSGFDDDIFARLAEIYKNTISTLKPRIIVQGEHGYLSDASVVNRVRAALFAGIRSAFLWGQLGGKRWQLIFSRRAQAALADALILSQRSQDPTIH